LPGGGAQVRRADQGRQLVVGPYAELAEGATHRIGVLAATEHDAAERMPPVELADHRDQLDALGARPRDDEDGVTPAGARARQGRVTASAVTGVGNILQQGFPRSRAHPTPAP